MRTKTNVKREWPELGEPVKRNYMRSRWEGVGVLVAVLLPLVIGVLAMATTSAAATTPELVAAEAVPQPTPAPGLIVNLNVADAVQLSLVPGLTPSKVRAIMEWRQHHTFLAATDLLKVRGIGMITYKKAKPWVAVDGPAVRRADGSPSVAPQAGLAGSS